VTKKSELDKLVSHDRYRIDFSRALLDYLGRSRGLTKKQVHDCRKEIELELAYQRKLDPDDATRDTQQH